MLLQALPQVLTAGAQAAYFAEDSATGSEASNSRRVVIIGGFATLTAFYLPLRRQLSHLCRPIILSPGPLSLNIWPLEVFKQYAEPMIEKGGPVTVIGHSLGGLQAIWLAAHHTQVKRVVTIGSPVFGLAWPKYELGIRALLGVDSDFIERFRSDIVPRVAHKLATIASDADDIAPPEACHVPTARNHTVCGKDHILLPYYPDVVSLVSQELLTDDSDRYWL